MQVAIGGVGKRQGGQLLGFLLDVDWGGRPGAARRRVRGRPKLRFEIVVGGSESSTHGIVLALYCIGAVLLLPSALYPCGASASRVLHSHYVQVRPQCRCSTCV